MVLPEAEMPACFGPLALNPHGHAICRLIHGICKGRGCLLDSAQVRAHGLLYHGWFAAPPRLPSRCKPPCPFRMVLSCSSRGRSGFRSN